MSFEGGFGRVEDDGAGRWVVPMGSDLTSYLLDGQREPDGKRRLLASVRPLAPVPRPEKIICVGLNYRDHAAEVGRDLPTEPVLFGKYANSVVGDGAAVRIPRQTSEVDYEGELGVVIGRTTRDVARDVALRHVAGYTVMNDLSARDLQRRLGQWTRGKAIDDFLPMGPFLVTPDEVGDPQALAIRTEVNGEVRQHSSTAEMVFGVAELISTISQTITLEAGDCIATGTPAGIGSAHRPPRYLRPGDEVAVEIAGIGRLVTRMVAC
jgi:2-keto-4-pentenoate hydratase/2-oxohepta-3-ene-1,7-dioic acid hydratase in catechol pathway